MNVDKRELISSLKAQRELGWMPKTKFEEGLRETLGWYLGNAAWNEKILSGGYALQRLGNPLAR